MFLEPDSQRERSTLDQPDVWQEITRIARAALRDAADADAARGEAVAPRLRARLRASSPELDAWDVRAQTLLQAAHGQPVVVVAVERVVGRADAAPASRVDQVRDRFGLSPRQAEVALLLARRLTDKEIAARLGISRHTARRHVEVVMIRLRVHSRSEVGAVLAA